MSQFSQNVHTIPRTLPNTLNLCVNKAYTYELKFLGGVSSMTLKLSLPLKMGVLILFVRLFRVSFLHKLFFVPFRVSTFKGEQLPTAVFDIF